MSAYQLDHLVFKYGTQTTLNIEHLTINQNKVTALIGANGCGKSTLLNLLAFLTTSNSGHLSFMGQRVQPKQLQYLRKRVGFLPQKPYMLKGNVESNIILPLRLHGINKALWNQKISAALEHLAISHLRYQPANTLSGGELQKAALARLLVLQPEVLLLDEPFSYLDSDSTLKLEQFIINFCQQKQGSLIFSTHDCVKGAELADEVVSLIDADAIKTPLINCFYGQVKKDLFDTGKMLIKINAMKKSTNCSHISIAPEALFLAKTADTLMYDNHFSARITAMVKENEQVRLTLNAGEEFQLPLPLKRFQDLGVNLGESMYLHFKSDSVVTF